MSKPPKTSDAACGHCALPVGPTGHADGVVGDAAWVQADVPNKPSAKSVPVASLAKRSVPARHEACRVVHVVADDRAMHRPLQLPMLADDVLTHVVGQQVEAALPGQALSQLTWSWARPNAGKKQTTVPPVWVLALANDALAEHGPASEAAQDASASGDADADADGDESAVPSHVADATKPTGHVSETIALAALVAQAQNKAQAANNASAADEGNGVLVAGIWREQARAFWLTDQGLWSIALHDVEGLGQTNGASAGGSDHSVLSDPTAWTSAIEAIGQACIQAGQATDEGKALPRPKRLALVLPDGLAEAEGLKQAIADLCRRTGMETIGMDQAFGPWASQAWQEVGGATQASQANSANAKTNADTDTAVDAWANQLLAAGAAVLAVPTAKWLGKHQTVTQGVVSRPGALGGLPVVGLSDTQWLQKMRQDQQRRWLAMAGLAAVWLAVMVGLSVKQDLNDAEALGQAVADAGVSAQEEKQLKERMVLYKYMAMQGPTPLAVVDELSRLTGQYMLEELQFDAGGQIRLSGKRRSEREVVDMAEQLKQAKTLQNVQLRSLKKSDREWQFEIVAQPAERFPQALVPRPKDTSKQDNNDRQTAQRGPSRERSRSGRVEEGGRRGHDRP